MKASSSFSLALVCCFTMLAQNKPDFSGVWKLNPAESTMKDKRVSAPGSLVWTLRQNGSHVTYKVEADRQGKKHSFEAEADIGGQAFESDAAGIIRWKWKGNGMVVETLYNPGQDRESSMLEIWTLSDDGKKLTDEVIYHMPRTAKDPSDVRFTRVFDKQ